MLFLCFFSDGAFADPAAELSSLFEEQARLEKNGAAAEVMADLNHRLAEKAREVFMAKGFKVGEVLKDAGNNPNFYFSLEGGPEGSRLGHVIGEASEHFKIGYRIQVGGLHYGGYDDPAKLVRLSPKFLELPETGMFNTILHETRHAYFWHLGAMGTRSPLNIDVVALAKADLTGVPLYENYFHFQELETFFRDFHQVRSGVTTNYLLEGMTPGQVVELKGEGVLKFTDAIRKHAQAAIDSLERGLASSGPLQRDTTLSKSGMILIIPVTEPGQTEPYANVRLLMPWIGPSEPGFKVRKTAIDLLKESIVHADGRKAEMQAALEEFRHHPWIGPPNCRDFYRAMGL
jgi:hypothetical protein